MSKKLKTYYKISREKAGLTQEQASEKTGICVRDISKYENSENVPDHIVALMSKAYNDPKLAYWHFKEYNPLAYIILQDFGEKTVDDIVFGLRLIPVYQEIMLANLKEISEK